MAEIATAYVSLLPSAAKFSKGIETELGSIGDRAADKAGKGFTAHLGGLLKKGAIAVGVAAGGVLATSLVKGWGRLTNIENATAKLTGLGNSGAAVKGIMNNALASVKGTAFGLDEAATTAAAVVAAGIKPGKELDGVLRTVADTATIAGKSMKDTGAIFGSVAARGKLQGDDLMQLQSAGVPVLAMLAKHYGITAAAASQMVTKGQVDFANFNAAMQENLGGAALKSGETTQGAFKNMGAAFSRFGATLLGGVFPAAKTVFGGITSWTDALGAKIAPGVEAVSKKLSTMFAALPGVWAKVAGEWDGFFGAGSGSIWDRFRSGITMNAKDRKTFADSLAADSLMGYGAAVRAGMDRAVSAAVSLSPKLRTAIAGAMSLPPETTSSWGALVTGAMPKVLDAIKAFTAPFIDAFKNLFAAAGPGITQLFGTIADLAKQVGPQLMQLVTLFSPIKLLFQAIAPLLPQIGTMIGQLASIIGGALSTALTSLAPIFTAVLDAVQRFVPFVTQLVASLLPPLSNLFQKIAPLLDTVLAALTPIIDAIASALIPILNALMPVVETVFGYLANTIKNAMTVLGGLIDFVTGIFSGNWGKAWSGIKEIFSGVWDQIKNILTTALGLIQTGMAAAWEIIKGAASVAWTAIQTVIITPMNAVKTGVITAIDAVRGWLASAWDGIKSTAKSAWGLVHDYIVDPLQKAYTWVTDTFGAIGAFVGNAFSGVAGAIKGAINGVITGVNKVITGINTLTHGVSHAWSWAGLPAVPAIPYIPQLAKGGPVSAGQPYIVGEVGPELFVPNLNGRILSNRSTIDAVRGADTGLGSGDTSRIETLLERILTEQQQMVVEYQRMPARQAQFAMAAR